MLVFRLFGAQVQFNERTTSNEVIKRYGNIMLQTKLHKLKRDSMLDKTISEHFINKTIEVYFGGRPNETITGTVVGSADGVIVLEHDQRRDFINVGKVVAFWEV